MRRFVQFRTGTGFGLVPMFIMQTRRTFKELPLKPVGADNGAMTQAASRTMRGGFHSEAGFVNLVRVELMIVILGVCLLSVVVFGSWPARIIVCAVMGGFCGWAYWFDWWIRFRSGDRVRVKFGPREGSSGTVVEPLQRGRGARVALVVGDRTEVVDFHGGYELQKIRGTKPA